MIARLRLAVLVARPAVVLLLALSGLVGLALAGRATDPVAVARLMVQVISFVVYAVSCNDLADLEIDRVNLGGDRRRPLVTGSAVARDVRHLAAVAAVVTTSAAASEGWKALFVALAGLAVATAYSLPPFRLSRRGVVAPLVLPALFVGLPFVLGVLAGRGLRAGDLVLLGGLYVGFVGRIVLKDFRDVVGDRLFGKRTFLVRHGRRATCALSGACWVAGTVVIVAATPGLTWCYALCEMVLAASAVVLTVRLAGCGSHRREERLVSALAIVGRGSVAALLAEIVTSGPVATLYGVAAATVLSLVLAAEMVRYGPRQGRVRVLDTTSDPVGSATDPLNAASQRQSSESEGVVPCVSSPLPPPSPR